MLRLPSLPWLAVLHTMASRYAGILLVALLAAHCVPDRLLLTADFVVPAKSVAKSKQTVEIHICGHHGGMGPLPTVLQELRRRHPTTTRWRDVTVSEYRSAGLAPVPCCVLRARPDD